MGEYNFTVQYDGKEFFITIPAVQNGGKESCVSTCECSSKITKVTAEITKDNAGVTQLNIKISEGIKVGRKITWSEVPSPIINKVCLKKPKRIIYGTIPTEVVGREFQFEN